MNLSVHHVAVIVSDYAAAKHFYVDLLGLPVVRENCRGNGLWNCAWATANWRYSTPTSRPRGCRTRRPRVCAIWLSVWTAWLRRLQSWLQRALRVSRFAWMNIPASRLPFFVTRTACRWSCTSDALRWKFLLILYEAAHGRTPCLCAAAFCSAKLEKQFI